MRRIRFGLFDAINYTLLICMCLIAIVPFLNVLAKSLSSENAIMLGRVSVLPVDLSFDSYAYVLKSKDFLNAFIIQLTVTVFGTLLAVTLTCLMAYPLSRKRLGGKSVILIMVVATMIFDAGLIPNYMVLRMFGTVNTLFALIIPLAFNGFNMFIVRSYMQTIPESVVESATIDGASHFKILIHIILPFSIPVLATIGLFFAVGYWNDYFNAMVYITKHHLKPLQLYMREIIYEALDPVGSAGSTRQDSDSFMFLSPISVRAATIIASTVPILFVYPLLQKYYIKGIMIGAVKE